MARTPLGPSAPRTRTAAAALAGLLVLLLVACTSPADLPPTAPPTGTATPPATPPNWFVDCSAPANGTGTRDHPWSTTSAIEQHGLFLPGERILLRRGTTCAGQVRPTGSGTNGAPIVLGAYGSGARPIVNGGGTPDQTGAIQLTDVHDWVVQDLEVTNLDPLGPDDTLRAGVLAVDDGSGVLGRIVIRRNVVRRVTSSPAGRSTDPHKFGGIAVLVRGESARSGALTDIRIEDNLVDHVGRMGIVAWSDAWPISALSAVSITGNRVIEPEGDGIVLWGVDGGVIEHNTEQGGGRLPECPRCHAPPTNTASAGIWPVMSKRVLIRYNEVSGVGGGGGDGQGFDIDDSTEQVVMEGNYSHSNDGGGLLICGARDAVVRANVFANDAGGEITFSCPTQRDSVRIVNNTFFLAESSTAQVVRHNRTSGTAPVQFANNVVIDRNGGGYAWPAPVAAEGNLYAGTIPQSAPADAGSPTDPGLVAAGTGGTGLASVSGYRPLPGSAAAGGGIALADAGELDYFGMTRTGSLGRGAIAATVAPPALAAVMPSTTRTGADVTVTWSAAGGTAWQVQRSTDGGPFLSITGVVTAGPLLDAAPPAGVLRYRLVQVGRDALGIPSAEAQPAR